MGLVAPSEREARVSRGVCVQPPRTLFSGVDTSGRTHITGRIK